MKRVLLAISCVALTVLFVLLSSTSAVASETDEGATPYEAERPTAGPCRIQPSRHVDHRWFFNASPYLWVPGVSGDVTASGQSGEISANTFDMIEAVDLGAGFAAEVGWCRLSVLADISYLDMSTDQVDIGTQEDSDFEQQKLVSHLAMAWNYSLHDRVSLGPVAGVRYVRLDSEFEIADGDDEFSNGASRSWFDPILGVRGRFRLIDPLFIPVYADVGGLGFGSRISWQAYAALGLATRAFDFELGYRHLYIDTEVDEEMLDYRTHTSGPMLRMNFRF